MSETVNYKGSILSGAVFSGGGTGLTVTGGINGTANIQVFETAGTFTWVKPVYGSTVMIECWGAGGGGQGSADSRGRGGGGGGSYSSNIVAYSSFPGPAIVVVGEGGVGGVRDGIIQPGNGGTSYVSISGPTTIVASALGGGAARLSTPSPYNYYNGGTGGSLGGYPGGAGGIGPGGQPGGAGLFYCGGGGAAGNDFGAGTTGGSAVYGGGGGGSGGGTTGVSGGAGGLSLYGGAGGAGAQAYTSPAPSGAPYGGGGGGGGARAVPEGADGGVGGPGAVRITTF